MVGYDASSFAPSMLKNFFHSSNTRVAARVRHALPHTAAASLHSSAGEQTHAHTLAHAHTLQTKRARQRGRTYSTGRFSGVSGMRGRGKSIGQCPLCCTSFTCAKPCGEHDVTNTHTLTPTNTYRVNRHVQRWNDTNRRHQHKVWRTRHKRAQHTHTHTRTHARRKHTHGPSFCRHWGLWGTCGQRDCPPTACTPDMTYHMSHK